MKPGLSSLKICLIGSTFYPSFHNGFWPSVLWSHLTYATTPILGGELEAHLADRAAVVPIKDKLQTSYPLLNLSTLKNTSVEG
jgi:hypothetical protein